MKLMDVKQLFAYNAWATNRIFDAVAAVPKEQYFRDMQSSFGGIHGTLTHLVGAEKIWLSRWAGQPQPALIKADEVAALADLKTIWETVGRETARFVATFNDKKLQDTITYATLKGDRYTNSFTQMFQHVVNHSSYHRGQVVTLLRQLGAKPVSTDLILFLRQTA